MKIYIYDCDKVKTANNIENKEVLEDIIDCGLAFMVNGTDEELKKVRLFLSNYDYEYDGIEHITMNMPSFLRQKCPYMIEFAECKSVFMWRECFENTLAYLNNADKQFSYIESEEE